MKVQADLSAQYAMRMEKIAQRAMKQEGEAAVAMIEDVGKAARPVGPNGEGSLINTTA